MNKIMKQIFCLLLVTGLSLTTYATECDKKLTQKAKTSNVSGFDYIEGTPPTAGQTQETTLTTGIDPDLTIPKSIEAKSNIGENPSDASNCTFSEVEVPKIEWTLEKLEGVYKVSSPLYPAKILTAVTKEGKVRHFEKYDYTVVSCRGEAFIKDNIVHSEMDCGLIGAHPDSNHTFQQKIYLNGVQPADTFQAHVFSSAIGAKAPMTFERLDIEKLSTEEEALKLLN